MTARIDGGLRPDADRDAERVEGAAEEPEAAEGREQADPATAGREHEGKLDERHDEARARGKRGDAIR